MPDKKAALIRLKIVTIFIIQLIFIINCNIQELIRHIHYFGYIFCHQNKTIKFC